MAALNSCILPLMPVATTVVSPAWPKFFSQSMRRLACGSLLTSAPPSNVLNTLVAWKLSTARSPWFRTLPSPTSTPKACAAS